MTTVDVTFWTSLPVCGNDPLSYSPLHSWSFMVIFILIWLTALSNGQFSHIPLIKSFMKPCKFIICTCFHYFGVIWEKLSSEYNNQEQGNVPVFQPFQSDNATVNRTRLNCCIIAVADMGLHSYSSLYCQTKGGEHCLTVAYHFLFFTPCPSTAS